ncbi:hypothetical protein BDA99DRAFT_556394 [Phascolomyces articulosus]|uniref:Uncharacterized protein n=1 Tax=Phascolomyces articulosus TaxID=60185 RepID=A0AAD5PHG7_9FUNG|nr:hypothetical protein BDA99DRAFT_556394 [Phascolomyces articulosus]
MAIEEIRITIREYIENHEDPTAADFVNTHLNLITENAPADKSTKKFLPNVIRDEAKKMIRLCPSQSLVLDTTDENWKTCFTEAELSEIRNEGGPLDCSEVPEELELHYSELKGMKTSVGFISMQKAFKSTTL